MIYLLQVPYDSAHRDTRMGRGPNHLLGRGVAHTLRQMGHETKEVILGPQSVFQTEIKTAFELHRELAGAVQTAVNEGGFPLVLSGNCNSAVGTIAGLSQTEVGVLWLDAHGDFSTPETTTSGFLDGMGLATLTGRCWTSLASTVPGFSPVPDEQIVTVGVRALDPAEGALLERSRVMRVGVELIRALGVSEALKAYLTVLRERVTHVYVHLDLDVYDPSVAPANYAAAPGGLTAPEVREVLRVVGERFKIAAVGIASYDPTFDTHDRLLDAIVELTADLAHLVAHQSR